MTRSPAICQPALSISTTACAPGATAWANSARKRFIALVSSLVITRATPVSRGTHRADDPGRAVAKVPPPARGIAALPPDVAGAAGLPDPRFVLAPDLEALGFGVGLYDLAQARGEPPFLKASCAFGSVRGWTGRVLRCDRSSDHNSRNIPVSL